jgi:ABC-type transport system involved in cytochrome c biogenesis permease subunit
MKKGAVGSILAAFSGIAFLMISSKFATDGDTMGVLVAVLDSNFWLSTHVVTISMGYAGCCAAGVIGHIYLLQAIIKGTDRKLLDSTYRGMMGVLAFGLIFSCLGTLLGGIWADQSWGRFWGWDPKENGALLIVLWCSLLYHAKIDGMIAEIGMAAGTILGILIVMLAWFGVNLLSVGLHSYGFTSGTATALIAFFVAELAFIAITVPMAQRRTALADARTVPSAF